MRTLLATLLLVLLPYNVGAQTIGQFYVVDDTLTVLSVEDVRYLIDSALAAYSKGDSLHPLVGCCPLDTTWILVRTPWPRPDSVMVVDTTWVEVRDIPSPMGDFQYEIHPIDTTHEVSDAR